MRNYGHYFEQLWQKLPKGAKDVQSCFMILLRYEEICIAAIWIQFSSIFYEIVDSNFSDMSGIIGAEFEPKRYVPSYNLALL